MSTRQDAINSTGSHPLAPRVKGPSGRDCIPQQYKLYSHTVEDIERLCSQVSFDEKYLLFVEHSAGVPIIQVGILGPDNYTKNPDQQKIVYGRKWRVEPELPTAEILQTIFLAIEKAREHEIREMFKWKVDTQWVTPFSGHMDFEFIVENAEHLQIASADSHPPTMSLAEINTCLRRVRFDHCQYRALNLIPISTDQWALQISQMPSSHSRLRESQQNTFSIILQGTNTTEITHALMNYFLFRSKRLIEEQLTFQGIPRFSKQFDIDKIAKQNLVLRESHKYSSQEFKTWWHALNNCVDKQRVPQIAHSPFSQKQLNTLDSVDCLSGYSPNLSP